MHFFVLYYFSISNGIKKIPPAEDFLPPEGDKLFLFFKIQGIHLPEPVPEFILIDKTAEVVSGYQISHNLVGLLVELLIVNA